MTNEFDAEQNPELLAPLPKKNYVMLTILVLLITVPVIPVLLYKYGIENASRLTSNVSFEIDQGDGVSKIAEDLAELGVIDSPLLFKVYIKLNNLDKNIQAGTYEIPPKASIIDIVRMLQRGKNDVSLTFIEGWSIEEFAVLASQKLEGVDYGNFVARAKNDALTGKGYLFPDTYFVEKDISTNELIDLLQATFEEKTQGLITVENYGPNGLTKREIYIFASIVEREVNTEEDRPIVAGILINRWGKGERLDADATTQYAIARKDVASEALSLEEAANKEWWPKELTLSDLEYDNLYNTRFISGVPPAPISSFGLSALDAVLNYKATDYNFYLTDEDGITHYAKTLAEHEANVATYL